MRAFITRHLRLLATIVGMAALAVIALWPHATAVETAAVVRGPLDVTVEADGVTRVRERFVVTAPVAGRLQRVEWEPGDAVQRGAVIARLSPADAPLLDTRTAAELRVAVDAAEAAARQADAERTRARAAAERARVVLAREQELNASGATARDDLDAAAAAARTADAALAAAAAAADRAAHDVRFARARLDAPSPTRRIIEVPAPCDGLILRRLRESESVVAAGEALLELGNSRDLEVVADLLSSDAVRVTPGAAVIIADWGGEGTFTGEVRRVEPSGFVKLSALGVEEQRVNVVVSLPEARATLGDGYRVGVRILIWHGDDVVKIPLGSLFRRGSDWSVFVADRGRAQLRQVRIGHRSGDEAEVTGGVTTQDVVILHPPDTLTDGIRISPLRAE